MPCRYDHAQDRSGRLQRRQRRLGDPRSTSGRRRGSLGARDTRPCQAINGDGLNDPRLRAVRARVSTRLRPLRGVASRSTRWSRACRCEPPGTTLRATDLAATAPATSRLRTGQRHLDDSHPSSRLRSRTIVWAAGSAGDSAAMASPIRVQRRAGTWKPTCAARGGRRRFGVIPCQCQ